MSRPIGVTILAVLYFLAVPLMLLNVIAMFVGVGPMVNINQQGGSGAGAGLFLNPAVDLYFMLAVVCFLLGWGLLKLENWARIIVLVLSGLFALSALVGVLDFFDHFGLFLLFSILLKLAICGLIIWYLLQPSVKAAFQDQVRATPA